MHILRKKLPKTEFYVNKNGKLSGRCKKCFIKNGADKRKTIIGLISYIYTWQKIASKRRGHEKPSYTLKELQQFILSQDGFLDMYNKWVDSGYKTKLKPSIDRINPRDNYNIDNISLKTWGDNKEKGHMDIKNGIDNRQLSPVVQMTKDGMYICSFISISDASRITGVCRSHITKVCTGERKSAGGFKWSYTDKDGER